MKCYDQNVGFPAGFLAFGEWQPYCKALETFLRQIAAHSILSTNKAAEVFLTSSDVSGHKQTAFYFAFQILFFTISPSKKKEFDVTKGRNVIPFYKRDG